MMKVKHRKYRDSDLEVLSSMILALYTEDPDGEPVSAENIHLTVREAGLHPDKLNIWIFEKATAVVGYSILTFFWSNEHKGDIINIDEIFLKPEYRSLGIGFGFIDGLAGLYPQAIGLKLEASRSNLRAISGYTKMGFKEAPNLHMIKFPLK